MNTPIDQSALADIEIARTRLLNAVERDRSARWRLRLWSKYVKVRDGYRCVWCDATQKVQARHIVRKSLFPWGTFELGNGITLCNACHATIHEKFNGKPDLSQPIGAEGGDDQDEWTFLFEILYDDAVSRQLDQDRFYFIGDHMLKFFKKCQGYEHLYEAAILGKISRISYAFRVWKDMPEEFYTTYVAELVRLNYMTPGNDIKWPT